ncbi:acetyltransferase [Sphingomonas sp. Leaf11]|nr:acetyltransferase [Sphingomonas sp. Leaf9]KQM45805.1 acetyltransferase [Sphingomonas sp. Leaf11]
MHRPVIDTATPADAAAIIALWQEVRLTRPWNDPAADFARAVDGATSTILVARRDGVPIGSVMVGYDGHRRWLYYLAVRPDAQGQGIGTALFDSAEQWLRARSVPKLQLMVRADNHAVMAFYRRIGLEEQGVTVFGRFIDIAT